MLIDALRDPAAYPHAVPCVEIVHTHASVVFLAGAHAYKVKKPVDFGFSTTRRSRSASACAGPRSSSTVASRRRRTSAWSRSRPRAIACASVATGRCEYAVKMIRLPDEARLGERLRAGTLPPQAIDAIAVRIARFHRDARRGPDIAALAGYDVVERNAIKNLEQLRDAIGTAVSPTVYARLDALTRHELAVQRSRIEARAEIGCETHGDLRLEHVYLFPDREPPRDLCVAMLMMD